MLVTTVLAALILGAGNGGTAAVRRQIEAQHAVQQATFKAGDLPAFLKTLTADYTLTELDGTTVTRAELEAGFSANSKPAAQEGWMLLAIDHFELRGNEAVVMTRQLYVHGAAKPTGPIPSGAGKIYREVWVKSEGGWRLRRSEAVRPGATPK